MAHSGVFAGFEILLTPEGARRGGKCLRVNDVVFVGACYPKTNRHDPQGRSRCYSLAVSEVAKLDAGLSCMSLRWRKDGVIASKIVTVNDRMQRIIANKHTEPSGAISI